MIKKENNIKREREREENNYEKIEKNKKCSRAKESIDTLKNNI